jgi:hypothetical protein
MTGVNTCCCYCRPARVSGSRQWSRKLLLLYKCLCHSMLLVLHERLHSTLLLLLLPWLLLLGGGLHIRLLLRLMLGLLLLLVLSPAGVAWVL